jgi:hypothetical protein
MITSRHPSSYRIMGAGLGQAPCGLDAGGFPIPCPETPPMLPAPLSPQEIAALSQYNAQYFQQPYGAAAPAALTSFLTTNPSYLYWGVGLLVAVALLAGGRR